MILSRLASLILRAAELICAVIVLGLMAYQVHVYRDSNIEWDIPTRFIYTLVISVLSVIVAVILFIPFTATFHWPIDIIFSALWFAAFGLLVDANDTAACGGAFDWSGISWRRDNWCGRQRSAQAFSFLAAIFFFATFLLSLWVTRKGSRETVVTTKRRGWGRRSAV